MIGPVVGGDRATRPKPDPDGLLAVCATLEVSPEHVAYVGDGPSDVRVARSCGATAVAAAWGHQFREDREGDVIVRSPAELLEVFGVPRATSGSAR